MVYLFAFAPMLYVHLSDETKKAILANRIRKRLFENLLLGVNLFSLEDIERVAKGVLQIPEPRLKNITRPEFMRSSLHGVDFIEESGYLV